MQNGSLKVAISSCVTPRLLLLLDIQQQAECSHGEIAAN